jgi:acid phosphatase (class A)
MEQMFQKLDKEAKHFGSLAKAKFRRERPPLESAKIQPLFDRRDERSYPSDHATRGMILAIVLSELEPAKQEALLERGRQIGWDRVIAGVHHPSDIMAGRVLGKAIALALLADKGFQEELAKVKEEYVRVKNR